MLDEEKKAYEIALFTLIYCALYIGRTHFPFSLNWIFPHHSFFSFSRSVRPYFTCDHWCCEKIGGDGEMLTFLPSFTWPFGADLTKIMRKKWKSNWDSLDAMHRHIWIFLVFNCAHSNYIKRLTLLTLRGDTRNVKIFHISRGKSFWSRQLFRMEFQRQKCHYHYVHFFASFFVSLH